MTTSRKMLHFACVSALLMGASVAAYDTDFKHVIDGESALTTLADADYRSLSAPELKQFNWSAVNIARDQVSIVTPDCETNQKNLKDLGEVERRTLESVSSQLSELLTRDGLKRIPLGNGEVVTKDNWLTESDLFSIQEGSTRLQMVGDKHYVIRSKELDSKGVRWLLLDDELVTFVYSDGRAISIQPRSCLSSEQIKLLGSVRAEADEAKRQTLQNMHLMHVAHVDYLAKEREKRNRDSHIQHDAHLDYIRSQYKKQSSDESMQLQQWLDWFVDQHEKKTRDQRAQHEQWVDYMIDQMERQSGDAKLQSQQRIDRVREECKQKEETEQRSHTELIERRQLDHKTKFEAEQKQHLETVARLEQSFQQKKEQEANEHEISMKQLEISFEQRARKMEQDIDRALGSETWTKTMMTPAA